VNRLLPFPSYNKENELYLWRLSGYSKMATIVIRTKNKRALPFLKKLFQNLKDVESFEIITDSTIGLHESVE